MLTVKNLPRDMLTPIPGLKFTSPRYFYIYSVFTNKISEPCIERQHTLSTHIRHVDVDDRERKRKVVVDF
jgi:hypothetical protein